MRYSQENKNETAMKPIKAGNTETDSVSSYPEAPTLREQGNLGEEDRVSHLWYISTSSIRV